jgi:hypothetical protein
LTIRTAKARLLWVSSWAFATPSEQSQAHQNADSARSAADAKQAHHGWGDAPALVRIRSPAGKTAAGCSRLSFEPCKAVTVIHQVGVGLLRGSGGGEGAAGIW